MNNVWLQDLQAKSRPWGFICFYRLLPSNERARKGTCIKTVDKRGKVWYNVNVERSTMTDADGGPSLENAFPFMDWKGTV